MLRTRKDAGWHECLTALISAGPIQFPRHVPRRRGGVAGTRPEHHRYPQSDFSGGKALARVQWIASTPLDLKIQPNSGHRDYSRLSCGVRIRSSGWNCDRGSGFGEVALAQKRPHKEGAADRGGPATSAQSPVRCPAVSSPLTMTV